jgi:hypothetical protein
VAPSEIERGLTQLESELKRLEAEYNMFFSGRLPKPPWETRSRVDALVKKYDRAYIQNTGDRFRFTTLQSRYATFIDLWDRGMRAREEGRSGPFPQKRAEPSAPKAPDDRIVKVEAFKDPTREVDKLTGLYESLSEARRAVGEAPVPFQKFAELVKSQVQKLGSDGAEVAFRVAVKDGKVSFTARTMKGPEE